MKNFSKKIYTLLILALFAREAVSQTMSPEWCEDRWKAETSSFYVETAQSSNIVEKWQTYRDKCEGTVIFESRLAIAYAVTGQFDKARRISRSIKAEDRKYQYLVDFSGVATDYSEIFSRDVITEADVRAMKKKLLAYVRRYPTFPDALGMLGGMQSMLGEHQEAIASLERGKDTEMDASGVYRNLTISYTEVGRYREALVAADIAYQMKKTLTSDQYFIYAFAKAHAGTGDFTSAETALQVIAAKKPEVRRDPDFKAAVDFLLEKSGAAK